MSNASLVPRTGVDTPALKLTNVSKSFGSTHAVKNVSLEVPRHEVVGLIGENGAGKSTLLKILTGLYQPDSGVIEAAGRPVKFRKPQDAVAAGIGVVHQEQSLLSNLSVAENIAMNALSSKDAATRYGFYRWKRLNAEAAAILARVGSTIDPRTKVSDLSFVDRQMVEIARALRVDEAIHAAPLVILDEPTSVLERNETAILEREIRSLKEIGSVLFVSHVRREEVTEDELFRLMIGQESRARVRRGGSAAGATAAVEARNLGRKGLFNDISFSVSPGRSLAIVGAMGSGRESVCRALFGAEPFDSGIIEVAGQPVQAWSMRRAVRKGLAYIPSERKVEGMVGGLSAGENLTLVHPGEAAKGPFLRRKARIKAAEEWFERLDVRPRDPRLPLGRFSGGNQQKVVMAKWLRAEDLSVLILDHPLRGLDPGASQTVNDQIRAAQEDGAAVILLPDTLEEALDMADEILVMRDGEITARFDLSVDSPTSLDLLEKMV
jgi:ribose transport system ATP-binding protein